MHKQDVLKHLLLKDGAGKREKKKKEKEKEKKKKKGFWLKVHKCWRT